MSTLLPLDVLGAPLRGINLIEASAGTGKTWTICGLYLRLLIERGLTVQQILVVTFTNAATAELRERIRGRILEMRKHLALAPATAGDRFIVALGSAIEQSGIGPLRCIELLDRALANFDEASIFTIHGFCQRALADNPFSAGLPMAMEPVEDDQELLMEAVNDFWRRHVAAASVRSEIALFLASQGDTPERFARLLARHLAKPLAKHRWSDDIDAPPMEIAALDAVYRQLRNTWLADKNEVIDLLRRSMSALNGRSYSEAAVRGGAEDWDRIVREDNPLAGTGDKAHLFRANVLVARTNKNRSTPRHDFFDQAEAYLATRKRVEASLAVARMRLLRLLFEEAGSRLRDLKLGRQVISFNDMLSNLHERLHNPAYRFLAGAIKRRFPVALIDEFQDTDPLQFDIFRTIYADEDSNVFVVGDPKQAIYGFRHADLHTYLRARHWATRQWSLADNQRSSERLLEALNGLFEANARAFILSGLDYWHLGFGEKRRSRLVDHSEYRPALQLWALPEGPAGPLGKAAARSAAVRAMAAEIARLIDAGSRGEITIDGQPLRPRDIAVLVRNRRLGGEMKQALAGLRVGAVEMSRNSVFQTVDAEELQIMLTAILSPSRDSLLRAALATGLAGCTAADIEAIAADEARLMDRIRQFTEYRDIWFDRGFSAMFRRMLADQSVAQRMLSRPDGERRLTNLRHLGEILQEAAETHGAPEALLRHLKSEGARESDSDAALLRLESDQNLVQIVTIHACKGLEYPFVFCPFVCDGGTTFGGTSLEGWEYHDAALEPVIDFRRGDEIPPDEWSRIKGAMQAEQAAETVRLLYVALTRAVHRCYITLGSYAIRKSIKESSHSMLNWLVAGRGMALDQWLSTDRTAADIDAAWQRFAESRAPAVGLAPLPSGAGTPVSDHAAPAITLPAPLPIVVAGGWRLDSYSSLSYGSKSDRAANDHDARAALWPGGMQPPAGIGEHDILRFPRGASAGECIHAVFEEIDFTDPSCWDRAIASALSRHPQSLPGYSQMAQQELLTRMLRNLVREVTRTTLVPGLELSAIPMNRRLSELEFTYPVQHLAPRELNAALKSLEYPVPRLQFIDLQGYLRGFIDLIIEHQGRFFIIDWKSNHLGFEAADYAAESLSRAMSEHGYHLQYLLYTVALDRFLRLRVPGYRYATHFGGVLYLFVRGIRPGWTQDGTSAGVYFHRPGVEAISRLDEILTTRVREASM